MLSPEHLMWSSLTDINKGVPEVDHKIPLIHLEANFLRGRETEAGPENGIARAI